MSGSNNFQLTATSSGAAEYQSSAPTWKSGLHQTPWSAILLVLIMLACMGTCAGIVIGSNNHTVVSWKSPPAVFLAFLSAVWNYSLGGVLAIGVAITWWRNARRGTTLETLHHIWNQGTGINDVSALLNPVSALRSSAAARKMLFLAWLVIAAQIANNPLLQEASHARATNVVVDDRMMLAITPRLPDGWLGSIQDAKTATIIGSRNGLSTVQNWWKNQ